MRVACIASMASHLALLSLAFAGMVEGAEGPGKPSEASDTSLVLPDAVVTATRTPRSLQEVPRAVNRVGPAAMAERAPRNSAEALREEAGIQVQKTEHGGGNAIIRGMGSSQVLLLVDGIRLNNSTYRFGNHPYLTTVDNFMLNRIEVVRGPGSTLFGSDAMGGTVNLITRTPSLGETALKAQGRASARYASADGERIGRLEGTVQGPGFALVAGAGYKDAGDLKRGASEDQPLWETSPVTQSPSGYQGYDYDGKLVFGPSERHRFSLAWQSTLRPEIPRFDRYEDPGFHRWLYTDQERDLGYLMYENPGWGSRPVPLRFFASLHRQQEGRDIQRSAAGSRTREFVEVYTYGCGGQAGYRRGEHEWTLGGEAYLDQVDSFRDITDAAGVTARQLLGLYPDGAYYGSYGAFVQDEWRPHPDWALTAGARYSLARMDFHLPASPALDLGFGNVRKDFHALTGSLGTSYRIREGIHLQASLSQGFRAPNLSDVSKNGEANTSSDARFTYEIPNPDLEPEKMISSEVGVKADLPDFKASLFAFRSDVRDLLGTRTAVFHGDTAREIGGRRYILLSKQNIGEAVIWGLEAEALARLHSRLWLRMNGAYTEGENTTRDEPVGGFAPWVGLLGLKWDEPSWSAEIFSRFAGSQYRLSADEKTDPRIPEGGSPGWATANIRGLWRLPRAFTAHAGVENLLDYNYREHGSGINAPGRNFIASLEWAL
jgi:outer membrane receptor protein involved in Fe transport